MVERNSEGFVIGLKLLLLIRVILLIFGLQIMTDAEWGFKSRKIGHQMMTLQQD